MKVSWVRALYSRASSICSNRDLFSKQLKIIAKMMSWNGFSRFTIKSILSRLGKIHVNQPNDGTEQEDICKIWIRVPYLGEQGTQLMNKMLKKIRRFCKQDIRFSVYYQDKKLSMFCSSKDNICQDQKANLIYQIKCPGCGEYYVGKTDRCFIMRLKEQGGKSDQPMFKHLDTCHQYQEYLKSYMCPDLNKHLHMYNDVMNNSFILDHNSNWNQLSFLEAYYIKVLRPAINVGLKASKELQLFR